jgi:cell division protein FtsL
MLGGEREAPAMIRAQRDMIKLEKEYYEDKVYGLMLLGIIVLCAAGLIWVLYKIKA